MQISSQIRHGDFRTAPRGPIDCTPSLREAASAAFAGKAASQPAVGQVTIHTRGDGTVPPAGLGNPSEWGVVKIKVNASANSISPMSESCVDASGGTWCYGSYLTSSGKYCYSNYVNNTKSHASSVKMDGFLFSSGSIAAGYTSYASLTAGACYTYYSIA